MNAIIQLIQRYTGAGRRGNLKHEIRSYLPENPRLLFVSEGSCEWCCDGNRVAAGRGVKAVVKQKEIACGMFRWDGVSALNIK